MKKNSLSLSVVLCCYNHGNKVAQQIEAICNQGNFIKELILLDDGSTDDSYEVMNRYKNCYPLIKLLRNEVNKGIFFSVNRACGEVNGDLVYFAAADDVIMPGFFKNTLELFNEHQDAGWSCAEARFCYEEKSNIVDSNLGYASIPSLITPELMLELCINQDFYWAPGQTTIYKYSYLKELGFFDENLGMWMDIYPQWILGLKYGFIYIPTIYAQANIADNSWGLQQTKNGKVLTNTGQYLARKVLEDKTIKKLFLNSGLLNKVVGAPTWMIKKPEYFWLLKDKYFIKGLLRDIFYRLPYKLRKALLKIIQRS